MTTTDFRLRSGFDRWLGNSASVPGRIRPAQEAEGARERMEIGRAPFIVGNDLLLENEPACGNRVEHSPQLP